MSCAWFHNTIITYFFKNSNIHIKNRHNTIVNTEIITSFQDKEPSAIMIQKFYKIYKIKKYILNAVLKIQYYAIPYIEKNINKKLVSIRTKRFNMVH